MKDNLFAMLMNFFEKSLTQLIDAKPSVDLSGSYETAADAQDSMLIVKHANANSIRVFSDDEKNKLTKASYQFMMKLSACGFISPVQMEAIIHQSLLSDSRFVTLQELKWIIRTVLIANCDDIQTAFLDLVLYQKEDKLLSH